MLSVHLIKKLCYSCGAPGVEHGWSDSERISQRSFIHPAASSPSDDTLLWLHLSPQLHRIREYQVERDLRDYLVQPSWQKHNPDKMAWHCLQLNVKSAQ